MASTSAACPRSSGSIVRTANSLYEVIVLSPAAGNILVRGGAFFPVFMPARLAGSSLGGSFLKLRSVHVGFRLEFSYRSRLHHHQPRPKRRHRPRRRSRRHHVRVTARSDEAPRATDHEKQYLRGPEIIGPSAGELP